MEKVRGLDVAPLTLLHVDPPFVLTCHCRIGVGVPVAAAVNDALLPAHTVRSAGFVDIVIAEQTVTTGCVPTKTPPDV